MTTKNRPSGEPVSSLRTVRAHTVSHPAPCGRVFPLLCPMLEYDWIEHWRCRMVHSDSGVAESDCVFTTRLPGQGGTDTWTCVRYEPDQRIEYVRMNTSRVAHLVIVLEETPEGCATTWTNVLTPLNGRGRRIIEKWTEAAYQREIGMLAEMMNHYLETGHTMPSPKIGHFRRRFHSR